ncbi:hypothetical protein [Costertonia aggregata]|uniref:Uncharacterized protein n=1 Tax=Costertonia aggregata TaxID=343403 RepID=A0A7H9ARM3_9FLAO|nr:hypothetical protein [Costertonia aggregata]QLG46032.1 hypothetical protein HYG79_11985 [Costertonia aggregata]
MNGLERAKLKDEILSYVLENGRCTDDELFKALGKPMEYIEDFHDLTLDIYIHYHIYFNMETRKSMVSNKKEISYDKTDKTHIFLKQGGCTAIEKKHIKEMNIEKNVKRASNKKTIVDAKYWWLPYAISGLSLLFAGWAAFKPAPNPPTKDEPLIEIQDRMDYIEGILMKQNDSLKNEIYEANLLIDSYEKEIVRAD